MKAPVLFEQTRAAPRRGARGGGPARGRGPACAWWRAASATAASTRPTAAGRASRSRSCSATRGRASSTRWGPGVRHLRPGDHVVLSWAPTCGRCHYCVIGRPNLCENRQPGRGVLLDGTTRLSLHGRPVYQYGHVATYASRTVVAESSAIPIRPDMPLDRAALIGCSVMTGVGAVINTAQVPPGASMAVFGAGGVGLNVVQGGALVTAHPIVAVDVRAERLRAGAGDGRHAPGRRHARGPGGGHPRHHAARGGLHVRGGRRRARDGPGHRRAGARGHGRPDRRAADGRDGAARRPAGREPGARDPRLELREAPGRARTSLASWSSTWPGSCASTI